MRRPYLVAVAQFATDELKAAALDTCDGCDAQLRAVRGCGVLPVLWDGSIWTSERDAAHPQPSAKQPSVPPRPYPYDNIAGLRDNMGRGWPCCPRSFVLFSSPWPRAHGHHVLTSWNLAQRDWTCRLDVDDLAPYDIETMVALDAVLMSRRERDRKGK